MAAKPDEKKAGLSVVSAGGGNIPKPKKPNIDWGAIEKDWRAGIKTKLQMSEEHGVSRAAMDKRFKRLGVDRDLTAKIQQRAQALVTQAMVTQEVTQQGNVTTATDAQIVEVNAQVQATALLGHRRDINRYRDLANRLLGEIETETDNPVAFEELADVVIWKSEAQQQGAVQTRAEIDRMTRMQTLFDRVMSNPGRVDSLKKLADTMKTLIGLERQALGLKEDAPPEDPDEKITAIVRRII